MYCLRKNTFNLRNEYDSVAAFPAFSPTLICSDNQRLLNLITLSTCCSSDRFFLAFITRMFWMAVGSAVELVSGSRLHELRDAIHRRVQIQCVTNFQLLQTTGIRVFNDRSNPCFATSFGPFAIILTALSWRWFVWLQSVYYRRRESSRYTFHAYQALRRYANHQGLPPVFWIQVGN